MLNEIYKDAEVRMGKSIDALHSELSKIRTGRAHPSILDHVTVDYYGTETPISQVASITVSDPRTLTIAPWEKQIVAAIEKAIMQSDLGLNPATVGQIIRVPLPPLNEERRKDLIKVLRAEVEKARIAIRNIRRDANADFKDLLKEKEISEDDERKAQDKVQQLTDKYIAEADQVLSAKEADIMSI